MSNNEYEQQQFWKMNKEKTISKNFYNNEIKGVMEIDGKRVLYIKTGVKRKHFGDDLGDGDYFKQLNQEMINYEKAEFFKKVIMGEEDYTNE